MQARLVLKKISKSTDMLQLLKQFDNVFSPPLSKDRQDFNQYANKLTRQATTYVAEDSSKVVGFITFHTNDDYSDAAFISLLAVLPHYQGKGIAQSLLDKSIEEANEKGKKEINLEVDTDNQHALHFYKKNHFHITERTKPHSIYMNRKLEG